MYEKSLGSVYQYQFFVLVIGWFRYQVSERYLRNILLFERITLEDIEASVDAQHTRAFDPLGLPVTLELTPAGRHKFRSQGEHHRYDPRTIHMLQKSVRTGDYDSFVEDNKDSMLSDIEHANKDLIVKYEEKKGYR